MATKDELIDEIRKLNPNEDTAGKTHSELTELLKALKAEQPTEAAEQPTEAAEQPTVAAEQPTVAAEQPTVAAEQPTVAAEQPTVAAEQPTVAAEQPTVAAGHSVTSKKGILDEGAPVKSDYFRGGETTINHLLGKGILTRG